MGAHEDRGARFYLNLIYLLNKGGLSQKWLQK